MKEKIFYLLFIIIFVFGLYKYSKLLHEIDNKYSQIQYTHEDCYNYYKNYVSNYPENY